MQGNVQRIGNFISNKFFTIFMIMVAVLLVFNSMQTYSYADDIEYETWNDVADAIDEVIEEAKDAYAQGDWETAYDCINQGGYYGIYETTGFERTVQGYISGSRVSEIELQFKATRQAAKEGVSVEEFNEEADLLSEMIREDANTLDGTSGEDDDSSTAGDIATFAACFGILLREGVEAILVLGAIIAYLVKSGNGSSLRSVYIGAILGVVCSFIAAWLLSLLKLADTASQEIIEGVTCLIAVVVLYYVSNWMLSKSESKAWSRYIEGKVASSVATGSMFALAFTAWLSVFREGAEVILFYQPLLADGNPIAIWGGFLVACVALAVIFILMRVYSVKLPTKPFFLAMSILMFFMSISFLGSGIKELIEGDLIGMHSIAWIPSNDILEVLGIYPCVETIVPQLLLLVITVVVFVVQTKRNRRIAAEVDAQNAGVATSEE